MSDVTELTGELAAIPSHEDETAAGDRIEAWLREQTDGAVTRDEYGNVIARRGDGGTSLALVGHHDVVPPDDEQVDGDNYVIEQRDGRIYGRGTADMKGAVAAASCAFRDADLPAGVELQFVSYVGEEVGGVGSRAAIDDGFVPDYAIVGEGSTGYSAPGMTDVAVAHKGRRGSTITAAGARPTPANPRRARTPSTGRRTPSTRCGSSPFPRRPCLDTRCGDRSSSPRSRAARPGTSSPRRVQ